MLSRLMLLFRSPRVLPLLICSCLPTVQLGYADDVDIKANPSAVVPPNTTGEPEVVMQKVRELDEQTRAMLQAERGVASKLLEVRKRATDLQRQLQAGVGNVERMLSEQEKLNQSVKEQKSASEKAAVKYKESLAAAELAKKAVEEAIKKAEEAEKQAKQLQQDAEKAALLPLETEKKVAALTENVKPLQANIAEQQVTNQQIQREIEELNKVLQAHQNERQVFAKEVESLLRSSGQWVSFSDQIAAIFYERCIACHHARNPQGRYNMTTYSAVRSPGESGETVIAGDVENSLLCLLIADGSMPKDADPLLPAQIALIQRWVQLGARLDIGTDPQTPLIRIMPRRHQPAAPESYHVPIPVTALALSPGGKVVASSGYHEVLLWSLPERTLLQRIGNIAERVHGIAFHPEQPFLAVASGTPGRIGEVKLFHAATGELIQDLFVAEDEMFSVAFSPDGTQLAMSGADGSIVVFVLKDSSFVQHLLIEDHADWVNSIAWSPEGRQLVSASRDKTAKVFDVATGKLLMTFNGHQQNVMAASWVPESQQIVSCGDDRRVRLWNAEDGKEIRNMSGFDGSLTTLQVLDKGHILSGGADQKVRIHSLADGKGMGEILSTSTWISSLAYLPKSQTWVVGDQSGRIHLGTLSEYKLSATEPLQTWQALPTLTPPAETSSSTQDSPEKPSPNDETSQQKSD